MTIRYFELEFSNGYSMIIKGTCMPSIMEAEQFVAKDMEKLGLSEIVDVVEWEETDARGAFDFEYEDKWPVFTEEMREKMKTSRVSRAYEKYKLLWMIENNYTLTDLIRELEKCRQEHPYANVKYLFDEWEHGFGFDSDIWLPYHKFLDCEYASMSACHWCVDGKHCRVREGIADDDSCGGTLAEISGCAYVDGNEYFIGRS